MPHETHDKFRRHLAALLRVYPLGTTADLLDDSVAFWDGHRVQGLYLSAGERGVDDPIEEFELTDEFLNQVPNAIADWIVTRKYSFRPSLLEWLKESPSFDASV